MPFPRSLQRYTKPEFYAVAPVSWERRLREISPVLPNLSHLRFRKFAPREDWKESPFNTQPDRPLWAIYRCTPRHLVSKERAAEFAKHWSEVPLEPEKDFPEGAQVAQRTIVSDYQYFMWVTEGVDAFPFWLLQGEWGGTPMKYTKREKRWMDASGFDSAVAPPGTFTPCVFDERSVKGVLERDRLVQASMQFDALEKMERSDWKKSEDDAAEMLYRETMLDTMKVLAAPQVEYMKSQVGKLEIPDYLPPAPVGLANTLATWKDVWKETGVMPAVGLAKSKVSSPVLTTVH